MLLANDMEYNTAKDFNTNSAFLNSVLQKYNAEIVPIEISKDIPLLPVSINGTICVFPSKNFEGFFIAKIKKNK